MDLIKNAWYVAALSGVVTTQTPVKRVMLGEPVVLYRTESGAATALSDLCPHRFAPLHKGKVKGDCIECPYHGLHFEPSGACAFNPHGDHKIPGAAKVRSYPVLERDGIVWAWTGDPALADPANVLDLTAFFEHGRMPVVAGDFVVNAHFELVIDNLMDLSHAPFLHPTTLADPDSVKTLRVEMKHEGDAVWAYHYAPKSPVSAQFAPFRPSADPLCDVHAHMQWLAPANLLFDVGVTDIDRPDAEGQYMHGAHLLTPIDMNHTRYTWLAGRNFALGIDEVSKAIAAQVDFAFRTEDEPMINAVAVNMGTSDLFSLKPVLLPGDAAAVRVRRVLGQLRERETAATAG